MFHDIPRWVSQRPEGKQLRQARQREELSGSYRGKARCSSGLRNEARCKTCLESSTFSYDVSGNLYGQDFKGLLGAWKHTRVMQIKRTLVDCLARYVTFMQGNGTIPIFQKRYLRSGEAKGMDEPVGCLLNIGLREWKTYF